LQRKSIKSKTSCAIKTNVKPTKSVTSSTKQFSIVGIGASAGGLAAFEAFFSGLTKEKKKLNMAFVLIQHLDPKHKSILTEIIARYTKLAVFEVENGVKVKPNCVYIIPPNREMALRSGTLFLFKRPVLHTLHLPIDHFFHSLATDQHERAIGIILSGTGTDGTLGARSIKKEGGVVMVQAPDSTEFGQMPQSAIDARLVDFILLPNEMPATLATFSTKAVIEEDNATTSPVIQDEDSLSKIFILLRSQSGHDFSQYKPSTIMRRLERRLVVNHLTNLKDYISLLQKNSIEIDALFKDLLIGVTAFFRDKEAFSYLKDKIIPSLFINKPNGAIIRVWIPGCSTGEEAYSIAILFQEHLEQLKQGFKLKIYATDIDLKAVELARRGAYPLCVADDVSPIHLARFFELDPDNKVYLIKKIIRDLLIFSQQNLIKDPPFSKMDFISCRNLLIYLNSKLQQKIIPLFHYSLNSNGTLFLGNAESIGNFSHLFLPIDRRFKLYQKKESINGKYHPAIGLFWDSNSKIENNIKPHTAKEIITSNKPQLRELIEHTLLKQFTPTSVLVDKEGNIIYIHGRSGRYLEPADGPGKIEMNIFKMAREGLKHDLLKALNKSIKLQETILLTNLKVKTNGDYSHINLTVQPINFSSKVKLYLIIFEETNTSKLKPNNHININKTNSKTNKENASDIALLRQALLDKEAFLQSLNEQLETTNEELRSSNEEMQSINEELQSTNEELETSKEELQSVNEELTTINSELQAKIADSFQANNDLNNLLAGSCIGTIFVDHKMLIKRFTPSVAKVINLIQTDVGRPLSHIVSNFANDERLITDVHEVLKNLIPREFELQTKQGDLCYLINIRPYRTLENVIEGAVLTFVDITKMKLVGNAKHEIENQKQILFDFINRGVMFLDISGIIIDANPQAEKILGLPLSQIKGRSITDPSWQNTNQDGSSVTKDSHPAMITLKTGKQIQKIIIGLCPASKAQKIWLQMTVIPQFKPDETRPYHICILFEVVSNNPLTKKPNE